MEEEEVQEKKRKTVGKKEMRSINTNIAENSSNDFKTKQPLSSRAYDLKRKLTSKKELISDSDEFKINHNNTFRKTKTNRYFSLQELINIFDIDEDAHDKQKSPDMLTKNQSPQNSLENILTDNINKINILSEKIQKCIGVINFNGILRSGTLINENTILTSADIFKDINLDKDALSRIKFSLFNNEKEEIASSSIEELFISKKKLEDNLSYNFAILIIKENLGNKYGYINLKCLEKSENYDLELYGYIEKEKLINLSKFNISANQIEDKLDLVKYSGIEFNLTLYGSPLLIRENNNMFIIGLHIETDIANNTGLLFTEKKDDQINVA